MSKFVKYVGTLGLLASLIILWVYNLSNNVEITSAPEGTVEITVLYKDGAEKKRTHYTIDPLQEGTYSLGLADLSANCKMLKGGVSIRVNAGQLTHIPLEVECKGELGKTGGHFLYIYNLPGRVLLYKIEEPQNSLRRISSSEISGLKINQESEHPLIAFSVDGNIWSFNSVTRKLNQLTNTGLDNEPDWAPDGEYIAFTSQRDGDKEIYVMNAEGSEQQNVTNNSSSDYFPDWSPDGMKVVFTSDRRGEEELFIVYPKTKRTRQLTDNEIQEQDAFWLPDGRALKVRSRSVLGMNKIHTIDFNGRILETEITVTDFSIIGFYYPNHKVIQTNFYAANMNL